MLIISDNIEIGKPFQEGLTCYLEGSVFEYNKEGCFLLIAYSMLTGEEIKAFHSGRVEFEIIVKDDILFFLKKIEGLRDWSASAYNYHLLEQGNKPYFANRKDGDNLKIQTILVDANIGLVMGLRNLKLGPELTKKLLTIIKQQVNNEFDVNNYYMNLAKVWSTIDKAQMI